MKLLNANGRGHWRARHQVTKTLRETACWLTRAAKIPPLEFAEMTAVYEPPDQRRRDPANLYPSWKAVVDGVVDAGVLPDDDAKHLDGPHMKLGEVHPGGRLVLYIHERPATPAPAPRRARPGFTLTKKPIPHGGPARAR
ncbi:hypothetical protein [Streptosporangium sandarakinum]|uniref:Uncharacterized protein n=1 Tax=Streptosporangium sandarakinum TaxID=1260955 RepID=A0A852V954_9ACTN|nr:hypothetical protein [Streptosporangium sandarakinum]NYF44666.1 hypothetical protein [Streptosporangium sandarakinum]